jgi:hypothetical protein
VGLRTTVSKYGWQPRLAVAANVDVDRRFQASFSAAC